MTLTAPVGRISDLPVLHAERFPDRVALWFGDEAITYRELARRVDEHARALLAHDVQLGDRVAILASPRPEFVVSYLAAASIGAVWQGLNSRYTARELAYVLSDARPTVVLAAAPHDAPEALAALRLAAAEAGVSEPVDLHVDADTFLASGAEIDPERLAARRAQVRTEDPVMVVYTSGSTGAPKGALLRHAGLVRLGEVESRVWGLEQPVVLCNLPINHIGCVGDLLSVPLWAGGTVVLRESFDAAEVLADISRYSISSLFQVPTQLQRIAAHPRFDDTDVSTLALVGWGGSALPQDTMDRYRARGCALVATYGLTEATFSVTYTDRDATDEVMLETVGRPDPDIDVRLLGEDGDWVAEGEEGEVCLRHPAVMAGYLNRPEETRAAFTAGGWLRTGDIGRIRPDGNLVLVGRVSEMYKSGGYNVYPREIELVLESHPEVAAAAVVARPDPEFQEVGVAYVQRRPGAGIDGDRLRAWARERLAGYKVPKAIVVLDELPLLPVGKVDKVSLKSLAAQVGRTESPHV